MSCDVASSFDRSAESRILFGIFFYANAASWTDFPTSDSRRIGQVSARIFQEDLRVKLRTSVVLASRDFRNSYGERLLERRCSPFPFINLHLSRSHAREISDACSRRDHGIFHVFFPTRSGVRSEQVRKSKAQLFSHARLAKGSRMRPKARARTFSPFNPCCIRGFFLSFVSFQSFNLLSLSRSRPPFHDGISDGSLKDSPALASANTVYISSTEYRAVPRGCEKASRGRW